MNENDFMRQQQAAVERMREMNSRAVPSGSNQPMPPSMVFLILILSIISTPQEPRFLTGKFCLSQTENFLTNVKKMFRQEDKTAQSLRKRKTDTEMTISKAETCLKTYRKAIRFWADLICLFSICFQRRGMPLL